ncbi:MAG TPA: hypothetical protein VM658_17005 [bacterium]|nr:hypothetical protein [bacterium]
MKRAICAIIALTAAALTLMLLGCAKDSGPGRDNQYDTGSLLQVTSLTSGDGGASSTWTIDVFQQPWCGDSTGDPEDFYDATFNVTFENLAPDHLSISQTGILVESYSIAYSTIEPTQPALKPKTNIAINQYLEPGTPLNVNGLLLMTIATKFEFMAFGNPFAFPVYKCTITFHGENDYGYEVTATASVFVVLGAYDNC